jgi:hypothetical protein
LITKKHIKRRRRLNYIGRPNAQKYSQVCNSPNPPSLIASRGMSSAPAVKTLVRLGDQYEVQGVAADANGKIYAAVEHVGLQRRTVLVFDRDNDSTELPVDINELPDITDISISPDGQELYVLCGWSVFSYEAHVQGGERNSMHLDEFQYSKFLSMKCHKRG